MRSELTDRSPVGCDWDPTPGSPEAVADRATRVRHAAEAQWDQADAVAAVLRTVAPPYWSGMAAEAFAARLHTVIDAGRKAAARLNEGADALDAWADAMGDAQELADSALSRAEKALEDIERTELAMASLGVADDATLYRLRMRLEDAQTRLDRARADAREAEAAYHSSETTFGRAVGEAVRDAMAPLPSSEGAAFGSGLSALAVLDPSASVNANHMSMLRRLTPEAWALLVAANPRLLQDFWEHPPSPDAVASWWKGLEGTPLEQRLISAVPELLGNLAGLPFAVRDRCNRAVYAEALKRASDLTDEQRRALAQVGAALLRGARDAPSSLVCFNLHGSVPLVAVGFGELDRANTVTWAAAGMDSDASAATYSWSESALNLLSEQDRLDPTQSHAVVAWLGYDAPDRVTVSTPGPASAGAYRFSYELDGTHAARSTRADVPPPLIAVVAHSYGTTMAAAALTRVKHPVDSFTMLGSAGIDTGLVPSLSNLKVRAADGSPAVYATAARSDVLAPVGSKVAGRALPNHEAALPGLLPLEGDLAPWTQGRTIAGARSFSSEGAYVPGEGYLLPTKGHSALGSGDSRSGFLGATAPAGHGYFDVNTESLRNTAATSIGRPELVVGVLTATK
ncbi:alpha/beta hydrolase [Leifsonia sp. AG29]|uniref:alpha/beta hydrolase n=1 Tax=Leifsonia sp. AG29 TaxID=2598860 RepID=UPI001E3A76CD|nr:alpha/beta hydrolase [Leifsonia sp. AG29]